jgi:hypothetical protein
MAHVQKHVFLDSRLHLLEFVLCWLGYIEYYLCGQHNRVQRNMRLSAASEEFFLNAVSSVS